MTSIVNDPVKRERELRLAAGIEAVFSLIGTLFMFMAIWGFTATGTVLGGYDATKVGGMSLLCFVGCMMIAAGGGIKKRFISLVDELEERAKK